MGRHNYGSGAAKGKDPKAKPFLRPRVGSGSAVGGTVPIKIEMDLLCPKPREFKACCKDPRGGSCGISSILCSAAIVASWFKQYVVVAATGVPGVAAAAVSVACCVKKCREQQAEQAVKASQIDEDGKPVFFGVRENGHSDPYADL